MKSGLIIERGFLVSNAPRSIGARTSSHRNTLSHTDTSVEHIRPDHRKGTTMETKDITPDIDQLMAEADALVNQINASFLEEIEEKHRIEFEQQVQRLKTIKSTVKAKAEKKAASEGGQYGEGIHEAIVDIVKAMKSLAGYLS
jgi:hypothetical protein